MKILCLYGNECALELFAWIKGQHHEIVIEQERLEVDWVQREAFDLVISYTYQYIVKQQIIDAVGGNIVNLHTSFLPFNRGSYPNIWSIIDHTPRGVTLHYINSELDKGDIISQKLVPLRNNDTLQSSYDQLDLEAKHLFMDSFAFYDKWEDMRKKCIGIGTCYRDKDFQVIKNGIENWSWDMDVDVFREKVYAMMRKEISS